MIKTKRDYEAGNKLKIVSNITAVNGSNQSP